MKHFHTKLLYTLCLSLLLAQSDALAADSSQKKSASAHKKMPTHISRDPAITYQRGMLQINSAESGGAAGGSIFNVEIRSHSTQANGWFNFGAFAENSGLLVMQEAPETVTIAPANEYAPTDILLINEYGEILQILPNLVLAELEEAIPSDKPVLATLYLKGGQAAALSISPGDQVIYKDFKKRPVVLREGEAPSTAPAPTKTPPLGTPKRRAELAKDEKAEPSTNTNAITKDQRIVKPVPPAGPPGTDPDMIDGLLKKMGER